MTPAVARRQPTTAGIGQPGMAPPVTRRGPTTAEIGQSGTRFRATRRPLTTARVGQPGTRFAMARRHPTTARIARPGMRIAATRRSSTTARVEPPGTRFAVARRPPTTAGPRLLLLLLLLAFGPLTACGDGDTTSEAEGPGSSGSAESDEGEAEGGTLELQPSTTTTTSPEDAALAALLPAEIPLPGFGRADDALGAGVLDLERAAAAEADVAGERASLEAGGFVRGASRAWVDATQDVVYVALYEFESAEGAAAYLEESVDRLRAREATPFEVPGVEAALGFTTVEESPQGDFTAHAVTFTRGERWVLALVGSPGSARSQDDARAVAGAQADLLG